MEGEAPVIDLPPYLAGARFVFVPDTTKEKDKTAVWLLASSPAPAAGW